MKSTTLKDIASELGVSVMTVSKALKNHPDVSAQRKKEVLAVAARLNYVPNATAQSLRSQQSRMIGIMVADGSNPYYSKMLRGIEEILSANGFYMVNVNTYEEAEKESHYIDQLRGINVAGILLTPTAHCSQALQKLKRYRIPYVLVNRYVERHSDNYVVADDHSAGYMAARQLLRSGDENIYALWFDLKARIAQERMNGVQSAFADAGRILESQFVLDVCIGSDEGYQQMKNILVNRKPPLSVLCFSDYIAVGAMQAIKEFNYRIPEDISIVGIDNIDFAAYMNLSSIDLPRFDIGKRSAELLLSMIRDDEQGLSPAEQHITLNTSLVERGSIRIRA